MNEKICQIFKNCWNFIPDKHFWPMISQEELGWLKSQTTIFKAKSSLFVQC